LRCGNASKEAVDLIEFALPHVNDTVYLSFLNSGCHATNIEYPIRNISFNVIAIHHVSLSLWSGRHRGVVRKVQGAVTYKLDIFHTVIEIDSRFVVGMKNDLLVLKGGDSLLIREEVQHQW
jgi:hypothetical protein